MHVFTYSTPTLFGTNHTGVIMHAVQSNQDGIRKRQKVANGILEMIVRRDQNVMHGLYKSLVSPHLECCVGLHVWSPHLRQRLTNWSRLRAMRELGKTADE